MLPNTLLEMQEVANAPWAQGNEESRVEYIKSVKKDETKLEKYDQEPPKMNLSPEEYAQYLSSLKEQLRVAQNEDANVPTFKRNENDNKSFNTYDAPPTYQNQMNDNGLVFHDFEYIGYQPNNNGGAPPG